MKIGKGEQFVIAFGLFWLLGMIDTALYIYHAFEQGYYFVAPVEFIVDYHTHGIGLVTICLWLLSILILLFTMYRAR